jgi:hypothetical protein
MTAKKPRLKELCGEFMKTGQSLLFSPNLYVIDRSVTRDGRPEHTLSWMGYSFGPEGADQFAVDFGGKFVTFNIHGQTMSCSGVSRAGA